VASKGQATLRKGAPARHSERAEVRGKYASGKCSLSGAANVALYLDRRQEAGSTNDGSDDKDLMFTHDILLCLTLAGTGALRRLTLYLPIRLVVA
jgi:hypothetical protein